MNSQNALQGHEEQERITGEATTAGGQQSCERRDI